MFTSGCLNGSKLIMYPLFLKNIEYVKNSWAIVVVVAVFNFCIRQVRVKPHEISDKC